MSPTEIALGAATAVGTVISAIAAVFGGGLFNRYIKHSNELAVTKYVLDQTKERLDAVVKDVAELKTSSTEVKTKIEQFEEHIRKLDLIPTLAAKMEVMEGLVKSLKELVSSLANERTHPHNAT